MSETAVVISARGAADLHRTLSSLVFQKEKHFKVYVFTTPGDGEAAAAASEFEDRLPLRVLPDDGGARPLRERCLAALGEEDFVCFLDGGVELTSKSLRRMARCIKDHPGYDVFHWNLAAPARKYPLKASSKRFFKEVFFKGAAAPEGSFVFRRSVLQECFAADEAVAGLPLAAVLSCAGEKGIRTARWERIAWHSPVPPSDPVLVEQAARERIAFFRWSERFFGDDYPVGTGDRLDLFAGAVAALYPSYTPEELKEEMMAFTVSGGTLRKMRASSALKDALKARQETLKAVKP